MTAWTELIGNSGILVRLGELGPAIDDAGRRENNTSEDIAGLERIRTILTFIGRRLVDADSNLLSATTLAHLASAVQQTTAHLAAFAASTDGAANLASAYATVDVTLISFGALVFPRGANDIHGLREAADAYREAMSAQIKRFETQAHEGKTALGGFEALLNETRAAFDAGNAELRKDISTFHDEIAAAQTGLSASHDAAKKVFEDEATTALAKLTSDFEAAEAARKVEHDSATAGAQGSFRELIAKFDAELAGQSETMTAELSAGQVSHDGALAALRRDYGERAAIVLVDMQKNLSRAQELVGAIGDHGVTGGFKKAADDALKQVAFFQWVTLGAMTLLILFTGYTALSVQGGTLNSIDLGRRLLFSVTVGALATYAASQANRYQQVERKNRKLELELRALGPFLEPVAPEEREKFRLKIAEVFFGKDEPSHHEKPGPATALHASKETFDKMLDVLRAFVEKK